MRQLGRRGWDGALPRHGCEHRLARPDMRALFSCWMGFAVMLHTMLR